MKPTTPLPLLNGLSISEFLAKHWQRKPLLIRQAIPAASGLLDSDTLLRAGQRDDVESRLVQRIGNSWQLQNGPFKTYPGRRSRSPWTLLVQGVNTFLPRADEFLRKFSFIPYARLDDVMASYAVPGGGVGPHFDYYDVFLVQISGHRHWKISAPQINTELMSGAPLRILSNFEPTQEWELEPGDMLYLPPLWAHDGIALNECITCSIGFRAPPADEIVHAFLDHLQDNLKISGRYVDPDIKFQNHPAQISPALIEQYSRIISRIKWSKRDVMKFVGSYLTEPKPQVFFTSPRKVLSLAAFKNVVRNKGIHLDLRTLMLYTGKNFFINGEHVKAECSEESDLLRLLADQRHLPATMLEGLKHGLGMAKIHDWYKSGFLNLDE